MYCANGQALDTVAADREMCIAFIPIQYIIGTEKRVSSVLRSTHSDYNTDPPLQIILSSYFVNLFELIGYNAEKDSEGLFILPIMGKIAIDKYPNDANR